MAPPAVRATRRGARRAGLLLHPTSLASRFAIGDLGPSSHALLAWLATAGLGVWQMLPLGPTGFGESPYSALSLFAGNPLLVSPEALLGVGLLAPSDLEGLDSPPTSQVDFPSARRDRESLLRKAYAAFRDGAVADLAQRVAAFASHPLQAPWLDDWTLFAALKTSQGGAPWSAWPEPLRSRKPGALRAARHELAPEIGFHRFAQFLFAQQWLALRDAAAARGLELVGDLPIYPAPDSAEVWARRELFEVAPDGRPRAVAGVPPDYFSADGQRWGNPLYRWKRLRAEGYRWWCDRVAVQLARFDRLRLDHFRGFSAYWRIPASHATAARGRWVKGPGRDLFRALERRLGRGLPLLAEDLGEIDAPVHVLRHRLGLPGMRVLQFAFAGEDSTHLPHHHERDAVVYTGTHDNDTTRGWFANAAHDERERALAYLGGAAEEIVWSMVRAAFTSVADLAVVPAQDLLALGSEARMNKPGAGTGNWTWRLESDLSPELATRVRDLALLAGRLPGPAT